MYLDIEMRSIEIIIQTRLPARSAIMTICLVCGADGVILLGGSVFALLWSNRRNRSLRKGLHSRSSTGLSTGGVSILGGGKWMMP
jgi:hypothetical protein